MESKQPEIFNGGKMPHVFKLTDNLYTRELVDPEADEALAKGKTFVKIDGSNHLILIKNKEIYERYDDKNGKYDETKLPDGVIAMPAGGNPSAYDSGKVKHRYFYKLIPRPADGAKGKQAKLVRAMYAIIDRNAKLLDSLNQEFVTVEMIGKKFQKTPGIEADVAIAIHSAQKIEVPDRTFEGIKKFLDDVCCEGIVISHKGRFWKIRSNCYDKNHLFEQVKKGKVPVPKNLFPTVILD